MKAGHAYPWSLPLNASSTYAGVASARLAADLQSRLLALKGEFYDPSTGAVSYAALRRSEAWKEVRSLTAGLRDFDPRTLATREERLAFWINVYNALVIDAIVERGVTRSVSEVRFFFARVGYVVGGDFFSADLIEHGILRGNQRPAFPLGAVRIDKGSPLAEMVLSPPDPRVHFALVCGSRGCPPIRFYDAAKIDAQLEQAARSFVNADTEVDPDRHTMTTSSIFRFYASDFGGAPAGVARFIAARLEDAGAALWLVANAEKVRIVYRPYDWSLNGDGEQG